MFHLTLWLSVISRNMRIMREEKRIPLDQIYRQQKANTKGCDSVDYFFFVAVGKHMSKHSSKKAQFYYLWQKWMCEKGAGFAHKLFMQTRARKEMNLYFMKCTCLLPTAFEQINHFQHLNEWNRNRWNWIKYWSEYFHLL